MISPKYKEVLKHIYIERGILNRNLDTFGLSDKLRASVEESEDILGFLAKGGYIDDKLRLTSKGRGEIRVGLIGGVFDILHVGHIATLREAKSRVDVLAVVIARNKTVKKLKGREPIMDEKERKEIVESIKYVDIALLGSEGDFMAPVNVIKPDIIFLGYDQSLPPNLKSKIPKEMIERLNIKVNDIKTTSIIQRIKSISS